MWMWRMSSLQLSVLLQLIENEDQRRIVDFSCFLSSGVLMKRTVGSVNIALLS